MAEKGRPVQSGKSVLKDRKTDMKALVKNALEVSAMVLDDGKVDINDYAQVSIRVEKYNRIITQNGMQPTIVGLASAMGLSSRDLSQIHEGTKPVRDARVKHLVDQMYAVTLMVLEEGMMAGIIKEITGIFLLKNNYGYQDTQTHIVQGGDLLGNAKTEQELLEQYQASVPMLDE